MKTSLFKIASLVLVVLFCAASLSYAQDSTKSKSQKQEIKTDKKADMDHGKMMNMDMKEMKMDKNMKMEMKDKKTVKQETSSILDSSVIRKGVIDLKAIDENKDEKVYQDVMDFNVISDKPGKCPLCKMTLKEVTLKEAREKLLEKGFKVK